MRKVVIADTTCLILFFKIDLLHILHSLYPIVTITPEVAVEFGEGIPPWINIEPATPGNIERLIGYNIGLGETTSLALAMEQPGSTVILDDGKAKKIARLFNLEVTGSLGIILKAKQQNLIENVKDVLERVKATNFHMPSTLENLVLKIAGELE